MLVLKGRWRGTEVVILLVLVRDPVLGEGKRVRYQVARARAYLGQMQHVRESLLLFAAVGVLISGSIAKAETYQVDTTDILFILSGAFVGLDKIVQQRMSKGVCVLMGSPLMWFSC